MVGVRDANLNALWCRCIAEELTRAGVRRGVLCPGSRNSPLIFALLAAGLDARSHLDERSAGFLALGLARASGEPVAVCVTSGSALANLLPAVAEAAAQGVGLVVLAADRPWELIGVGAPQAMSQRGLFAGQLVGEVDLGEPSPEETLLLAVRARISRLVQQLAGPVLINVPMRDPLPPLVDPRFNQPEVSHEAEHGRAPAPYTSLLTPGAIAPGRWPWLRPGLRGLVLAGATGGNLALAGDIARGCGFPLLADAASGLRGQQGLPLVGLADALALGRLGEEQPELIIQVGAMPLARSLCEMLARQRCPWLCLDDGRSWDYLARAWAAVPRAGSADAEAIHRSCAPGDGPWRERWLAAERAAAQELAQRMRTEPWGEVLAAHLACTHAGFSVLHLASSMAIRHGNVHLHAQGPARRVHANRGLNGIDGTLGSFLGELIAERRAGLLLIGDLAFLHDLPALAQLAQPGGKDGIPPGSAIVVLNNDGGGIFDFLPVAQVPGAERWVRTPQGHDLASACRQFGLPHRQALDRGSLEAALAAATDGPGLLVIECQVPGGCVERHRLLLQALAKAGDAALNDAGVPA